MCTPARTWTLGPPSYSGHSTHLHHYSIEVPPQMQGCRPCNPWMEGKHDSATSHLLKCNNSPQLGSTGQPHNKQACIGTLCSRIATANLHKDTKLLPYTAELLQRQRMWIHRSIYKWMWAIQMYIQQCTFLLHLLGKSALKRSQHLLSVCQLHCPLLTDTIFYYTIHNLCMMCTSSDICRYTYTIYIIIIMLLHLTDGHL